MTMRWPALRALVASAALLSGGLSAQAAQDDADIDPGIYGNVKTSRVTGDMGGLEIEIHPDGRTVEMTLCEGWCNSIEQRTYRTRDRSIEYEYREEQTEFVMKLRMRRKGKNLLVEQQLVQSGTAMPTEQFLLKRLKTRFGLAAAEASMREAGARRSGK